MKLIELLEVTNPDQTICVNLRDNSIAGTPNNLMIFMNQSLLQYNIFDIHVVGSFIIVGITVPAVNVG